MRRRRWEKAESPSLCPEPVYRLPPPKPPTFLHQGGLAFHAYKVQSSVGRGGQRSFEPVQSTSFSWIEFVNARSPRREACAAKLCSAITNIWESYKKESRPRLYKIRSKNRPTCTNMYGSKQAYSDQYLQLQWLLEVSTLRPWQVFPFWVVSRTFRSTALPLDPTDSEIRPCFQSQNGLKSFAQQNYCFSQPGSTIASFKTPSD